VDTKTTADQKNKLGLSVAIGAGVGAALGVALHHLPLWLSLGCHRDRNYFDANDAILILSRYFGSLNVVAVNLLPKLGVGVDLVRRGNWLW